MAVMGMRLARYRNGVSELHGSVSRRMFAELWPGVPEREIPVGHINNGVHGDTWVAPGVQGAVHSIPRSRLAMGRGRRGSAPTASADGLDRGPRRPRSRLVRHVRRRMYQARHRLGPVALGSGMGGPGSRPRVLTICFARRMATHKRAALLLSQPDRPRARSWAIRRWPVQFVFAGKAHPEDDHGKEMIRRLVAFSHEPELRGRFVFVEDYDMALARTLVQGADVWLNTPKRPLEASGTSGMKAVLNGALHCSVLDGWWARAFSIAGTERHGRPAQRLGDLLCRWLRDDERRTLVEANSLFELLEHQIVPLFAERDERRLRRAVADRIQESLRTLGPLVGAHRMVRDYVEDLYLPAASTSGEARPSRTGRRHGLWQPSRRGWRGAGVGVRVEQVEADEVVADLGTTRAVEAVVALGDLDPDEVEVQLVAGRVGSDRRAGGGHGSCRWPASRTPGAGSTATEERHRWTSPGAWA